jgi:hypothetical protein
MVQSHDPPSPESGRDKRYYGHVMKDFHEQYDSVGQTSQSRDNRINTPAFTIISCTQSSPIPITTTPAHEYRTLIRGNVTRGNEIGRNVTRENEIQGNVTHGNEIRRNVTRGNEIQRNVISEKHSSGTRVFGEIFFRENGPRGNVRTYPIHRRKQ